MRPNLTSLLNSTKMVIDPVLDSPHYRIERSFNQMFEETKKLAGRSKGTDQIQGQHFLAKAVDGEKMMKNIQSLDLKTVSFESAEVITENQLDDFLNHELEMAILTAIQETKKETEDTFYDDCTSSMDRIWSDTKLNLAEKISKTTWSSDASSFKTPRKIRKEQLTPQYTPLRTPMRTPGPPGTPLGYHIHGTPGGAPSNIAASQYSIVVDKLSAALRDRKDIDVCSAFYSSSMRDPYENDQKTNHINNSWWILRSQVGHNIERSAFSNKDSEKQKILLHNTITYLEKEYFKFMKTVVRNNPEVAEIGGEIGTINLIKAFLSTTDREYSRDSGSWCLIYYCIRVGKFADARKIAEELGEEDFVSIVEEYTYNRNMSISETQRSSLRLLFREISINSTEDAYKSLLYNLFGRFDNKISYQKYFKNKWKTPDYMWFQLNMIDCIEEQDGGSYPLTGLQKKLIGYGAKHFNPRADNPFLYFHILLQIQKYEMAINYLYFESGFEVEAVHFAIAMCYCGLITETTWDSPELYNETDGIPSINYTRLIKTYVDDFSSSYPIPALKYLSTISSKDARLNAIKDLIMETGDFEALLGFEHEDGNQVIGGLHEYIGDDWKSIVKLSASESENQGDYERAAKLFDLVHDFHKVYEVISKELSKLITLQTPDRQRIIEIALYQKEKYENLMTEDSNIAQEAARRLDSLLQLSFFFDLYHSKQYSSALQTMRELQIIPLHESEVEVMLDPRSRHTFSNYVRDNLSDILVATMKCLHHTHLANQKLSGTSRYTISAANALVIFAGSLIDFRLPPRVYGQLVQMQAQIS